MSIPHLSLAARIALAFRPRIEEKSNPAFAGVTMFNDVPQPHTMPRNYKNYADQGYASNDSVYKCVSYIVINGAAIPPKLYSDATKETEIKSHPLLDKLARPNMEQDGVTFREAVLGWYLIAGNAFLYAIRPGKTGAAATQGFGTTGAPDELWTLDPNKVHPMPHPTDGITGYKYDDFADAQSIIPPANIGHLRTWNPKDPIFGLSPIEVAALMVDQQNAARKWNLALLQNMAKPSGAWVTDVVLDKPSRDRLEEQVHEKLAGARNAGKTPVLDAGAKWVPTGTNPSELDWLESLKYNAGQIANLYNIPPQLIGDTSATTYNNMEQAKAASYTEAIFPALDKLYSLLTMWLIPMYPDLCDAKGQPKACLYYDKDTVEVVQNVIQQREQAKADRAVKAWLAGSITLNESRDLQGLPDLGDKGNVYRIGAVLVPADKLDEYAAQSLTEPAAPPIPLAEPIQVPPVPGDPNAPPTPPAKPPVPPQAPEKPATPPTPADAGKEPPTPAKGDKAWLAAAAQAKQRTLRLQKVRGGAAVTHLLWECQPTACEFCLDNDGVVVEEGESFPNGATSPDDCHRFCECTATELAVPDEMSADDMLAMGAEGLIALYAVGFIASRHDRDVAAQAAQDAQQQSDDDEGDDESDEDQTGATYAARKKARDAFRQFREVTVR